MHVCGLLTLAATAVQGLATPGKPGQHSVKRAPAETRDSNSSLTSSFDPGIKPRLQLRAATSQASHKAGLTGAFLLMAATSIWAGMRPTLPQAFYFDDREFGIRAGWTTDIQYPIAYTWFAWACESLVISLLSSRNESHWQVASIYQVDNVGEGLVNLAHLSVTYDAAVYSIDKINRTQDGENKSTISQRLQQEDSINLKGFDVANDLLQYQHLLDVAIDYDIRNASLSTVSLISLYHAFLDQVQWRMQPHSLVSDTLAVGVPIEVSPFLPRIDAPRLAIVFLRTEMRVEQQGAAPETLPMTWKRASYLITRVISASVKEERGRSFTATLSLGAAGTGKRIAYLQIHFLAHGETAPYQNAAHIVQFDDADSGDSYRINTTDASSDTTITEVTK